MFAHVYCPNFLVQCERLFRPQLNSRAMIILEPITHQGSDYIKLLASSSQARDMGFEMNIGSEQLGQLIEQCSSKQEPQSVIQCQANKEFYADMSERLFRSLEMLAPSVTPLACDEAFLNLTKLKQLTSLTQTPQEIPKETTDEITKQLHDFAYQLRGSIKQWLGLEIFVGIGTTKTLAYLGYKAAEREFNREPSNTSITKLAGNRGTTVLTNSEFNQSVLARFPASKIKGISAKALSKLSELGIHTALELSQASSQLIGKRCSVMVEHIAIELAGLTSQLTSEQLTSEQMRSNQLTSEKVSPNVIKAKPANKLMVGELQEQLASYTNAYLKAQLNGPYKNGIATALLRIALAMLSNAHKELITRQLSCHKIEVNVERVDLHVRGEIFIERKSISLSEPTDTLSPIKKLCRHILESIYSHDAHYNSISLTLTCQDQYKAKQVGLFDAVNEPSKTLQTGINKDRFVLVQRYCELYKLAKIKKTSYQHKSPSYTTQWHELLRVN